MIAPLASLPPMSSAASDKASAPLGGFGLPSQAEPGPTKGLSSLGATQAPLITCTGIPDLESPAVMRLGGFDLDFLVDRARQENAFVGRDHAPSVILVHDSDYDALDDLAAKLKDFSGDIVEPGGHVAITGPRGTYSAADLQAAADESGLTILVAEGGRSGATVYRPGADEAEFDPNISVDDGGAMTRCPGPGSIDFGN
jgi:hypothetical protein